MLGLRTQLQMLAGDVIMGKSVGTGLHDVFSSLFVCEKSGIRVNRVALL